MEKIMAEKTNEERLQALEAASKTNSEASEKVLTQLQAFGNTLERLIGRPDDPAPNSIGALLTGPPRGIPMYRGKPKPTERGTAVGVCRHCAGPVRDVDGEVVCITCGRIAPDGAFYGRLCADCPHVESAHNRGATCIQCECPSFRLLESLGVEELEYARLITYMRGPDLSNVQRYRETLPAIVFFRATQTRLLEIKTEGKPGSQVALVIAREAAIAFAELKQEERERVMKMSLARGETNPGAEYENYQYRIGQIIAGGVTDSPELRELTRAAGEAYGRMTPEQKKNVKRAMVALPDEAVSALAPPSLPNVDEEVRADMHVVFSLTRSQAKTLEWGLEHATVKEGAHKPEDISELAANLLLPSFMFMLKNIAVAREKWEKDNQQTVHVSGRQAGGKTESMRKFVEKKQAEGVNMKIYPPGALGNIMGTSPGLSRKDHLRPGETDKVPVTDGFGGPKVGEMTTHQDAKGNIMADIEITDPEMQRKIDESTKPGPGRDG